MFGFCITHILNTGCAKIWKKSVAKRLKSCRTGSQGPGKSRELLEDKRVLSLTGWAKYTTAFLLRWRQSPFTQLCYCICCTVLWIMRTFHIWYCSNRVSSCNITYVVQQDTQVCYGWIFIHNMFESSTCFSPTGPSSEASINCVLLVWYVKIVCCSVRPYVRGLWKEVLPGLRYTYIACIVRIGLVFFKCP